MPALVDERTFDLAQERLQDNKKFAPRRTVEPSILQGLVHCAQCGYALYRTSTRTSARKIYYYRCLGSDAWRYQGQARCSARAIRLDLLEDTVWTEVARLLEDPALIQAELNRRVEAARTSHPAKQNQDSVTRELLLAQRRVERLLTAYQEDLLSLDELRRRMPELRQRETRLKAELESLSAQLADQATYLRLAHTLGEFLERLRTQVQVWTCSNASASSDCSSRKSSSATTASPFDIRYRTRTVPPAGPRGWSTRACPCPAALAQEQVCYCVHGVVYSPLLANLYMRRFVLAWKKLGLEQSLGSSDRDLRGRSRDPVQEGQGRRGLAANARDHGQAEADGQRGEDTNLQGPGRRVRLPGLHVWADVLGDDWPGPSGHAAVEEEHPAHGREGP